MTHVDLCIVGTGSGNSILDDRFADLSVAIVERDVFGGTCLNRGCIPTKMLVHPADIVTTVRHAGLVDVDARVEQIRWPDIRDRVFGRIDPIAVDGERYRRSQDGVQVLRGTGRFVAPREMAIVDGPDAGATVSADRWVLAAGARPAWPDIEGLDAVPFHTSDTIMRLAELPRRLVILGGGFIGCELAHVFDAFGVEVHLVTRGPALLRDHDDDVSRAFTAEMSRRLDVRLERRTLSAGMRDGAVVLHLEHRGKVEEVESDALLVATGRLPNSDLLDAAAGGVEVDAQGFVRTDDTLRTSADGVYALGDLRTPQMLKHVANHEARVVQHNLLHPEDPWRIDESAVPHAVFSSPQVAAVGLTETAARAGGHDVSVAVRHYRDTAYGWALEDTTSFVKLVADGHGRLLGAHVMGPHAAILVQQLVQGMVAGLTVERMARLPMYIHPALTEVVEQALLEL